MNDMEKKAEGVYDVDAIASLFDGGAEGGSEEGEALPEEVRDEEGRDEEGSAAEDKTGSAAEDAAGAADDAEKDAGKDEEGLADVPMPEGFEEALWSALSPEARSAVHSREQAHAAELSQARQKEQAARQREEQFAVAANAELQHALAAMKQIVEAEYGSVDWNALAERDPAAFVKLRQACASRMDAVRRVQERVTQAARRYEAERAAQASRAMADEFARVQPELRALMGAGFNGRTFAANLAEYMKEQGCPPSAVNGLTKGYEVKLVAKAMLYDALAARRAAAVKKVADAPSVRPPRASAADPHSARASRARDALARHPDSTDALAALFEATM